MPGWIIQGVRGEGKSLAAVGKIKEYMLKGRPVATNLDLFLDGFLPEDNSTIAYRLPDHPRLEDLEILPPAYDPKYKAEDMNGLLVLDELGTWLNARSWNEKTRLKIMNWLFLSRKNHWDIILLAQDHEMIDAQLRNTLCDYLVQASRMDRQKIPYLSGILKNLGFSGKMPQIHKYAVYYGMTTNVQPEEIWSFTGKDLYNGYNTNQLFKDGTEALCGTLVDMRATYSYIPANYLTKRVFIDRLNNNIEQLRQLTKPIEQGAPMAKKGLSQDQHFMKIGFLVVALVGFLAWRFLSGGFNLPKMQPVANQAIPVQPAPIQQAEPLTPEKSEPKVIKKVEAVPVEYVAQQTNEFIEYLLKTYRPRLSTTAYSPDLGIMGNIDFYDENTLVESYSIKELHALGVTLIRKPYGVDLIYQGKAFLVSSWRLPDSPSVSHASNNLAQPIALNDSGQSHQPEELTDKLYK